jgi:hypothetical protein
MKTWFRVLLVTALLLGLSLWYLATHIRPCNLRTTSPDRVVQVFCLPFQGVSPHPLDRCTRIYISSTVGNSRLRCWQTTIHCDGDIRVSWLNDPERSFTVFKGSTAMMTWRTSGAEPACTFGESLITYDPHELWSRTGPSTPEPSQP